MMVFSVWGFRPQPSVFSTVSSQRLQLLPAMFDSRWALDGDIMLPVALSAGVLCVASAQLAVLFSRRVVELCMYQKMLCVCCMLMIRPYGSHVATAGLIGPQNRTLLRPVFVLSLWLSPQYSRATAVTNLLSQSRHGHFCKYHSALYIDGMLRQCWVSCMFTAL